jgi:hypothetical protein
MGIDIGSITKAVSNPATLFKSDNKPLKDRTHPYEHATKLFIADSLKLAPKNKYLYYVSINIGVGAQTASGIFDSIIGGGGSGVSSLSLIQQYEAGMLVKSVDLPKFSMDVKTINSYNKKSIVQTAIKYEPVSITFHDDSANIVNRLWNDYYTYYYRDSDYSKESYQQHHINTGVYASRTDDRWGYTIRNAGLEPFLRNIQIFSLHNKRFIEYTLINPYITSWRHGTHSAEGGNDIMENQMTVMFETVKYKTGSVNAIDVNGFGTLHYDNTASPISGGGLFGQIVGGIAENAFNGSGDLARPDGSESKGSIFSQIGGAASALNALGGLNLEQVGAGVLGKIGGDVLKNATAGISIPSPSDLVKGATSKISDLGSKLGSTISDAAGSIKTKLQSTVDLGPLAAAKGNNLASLPGIQNITQGGYESLIKPGVDNLTSRGTTSTGGGFIGGGYGSVGPSGFTTPAPANPGAPLISASQPGQYVSAFNTSTSQPVATNLTNPDVPTDSFFI